jgi:adenosylmethionine---8-amino-7-oxononanoate aminotransferase
VPPGASPPWLEAAARHDVLVIHDEVATGFGRTGTLFATEQCGTQPDLMVIGKGLTGGYLPMAATVASQRVWEAFLGPDLSEQTFYHGHSYSGNALAAAVALRHLELLDEWDVLANVVERAEQLGRCSQERIEGLARGGRRPPPASWWASSWHLRRTACAGGAGCRPPASTGAC